MRCPLKWTVVQCSITILIFAGLIFPNLGHCNNILIVLGHNIQPYLKAAEGVNYTLSSKLTAQKSIQPFSLHLLTPESNQITVDEIHREILNNNSDLILAIGTNALLAAKDATQLPIIYLMVPQPKKLIQGYSNITGINMEIEPSLVLRAISVQFPKVKNIGLLYDPSHNHKIIRNTASLSQQQKLITIPVTSSEEVPSIILQYKGLVDALWLVPDSTVITDENLESLALFSLENRVPIIAFARKYLKKGAVMSVSADPFSMGKEAGNLAVTILQGVDAVTERPRSTQGIVVDINESIMRILNINGLKKE